MTSRVRSRNEANEHNQSKELTYPHVVRKGSVQVTIYRINNPARGNVFEVTWFKEGRRNRRTFRDPEKAQKHAAEIAKGLDSGKGDSLALSGTELEGFKLAKKYLSTLVDPPPLHSAIQEFVAARQLLGNKPVLQVIEKYLADAADQALRPMTVSALVEEFISSKHADGVSERYLQDCRSRLGRFARDFQTELTTVKTAHIDTWLRNLKHSPRSRNNYRVLLVTMFRFARACGYLLRDRKTEADHVALAKDRGNPIEIYSLGEMQKLLDHSDEHTLPFVALAGFAGLRSAEIQRLTWDSVLWDQGLIDIKAKMAKTAQRRLVPLAPSLAKILKKWRNATGPVIGPVKIFLRLEWLAKAAGLKWKRNALRHSYASYRLALIQDAGKLALEMGNSPSMVFRHYRELVLRSDAEKWFILQPRRISPTSETNPNKKLATRGFNP